MCQQALDACAATNMTSRGIVMVDIRAGAYRLRVPDNWEVMHGECDMADCMRHVYYCWPDEATYGWIADDMRPRTEGWDAVLEEGAGQWDIATCRDMLFSEDRYSRNTVLCGAMCWGGELVRAVGWWAPNFCRQAGIDDTWKRLYADKCGRRFMYNNDVLVEHLHWRNRTRPKDETDNHERDGVHYIAQDFAAMQSYWGSQEFGDIIARVQRLAPAQEPVA